MTLDLVARACGHRHGMVTHPTVVPTSAADPQGVIHASVSRDDDPWRSAGGGAARTVDSATVAAVAESLERFAAMHATIPVRQASALSLGSDVVRLDDCSLHSLGQRSAPGFPHANAYPEDEWLAEVFDLRSNEPRWVPAALVSLTDDYGALATSSGLAAAPTVLGALLRALQELVERDAYVVSWLHQVGGREVAIPEYLAEVAPLGGTVRAFDLTPAFSPHPVALVAGTLYSAGAPRHSIGIACRATWADAVEKAYLECCQGTVFVGHTLARNPQLRCIDPADVRGFDEHAIYYAANPARWADVPLMRFAEPADAPVASPASTGDDADQLIELVDALIGAGMRPSYRELTTVDCRQIGLRVVRVVVPELTPLHHDHRWPFLGGRTADVDWRYPDAADRLDGRWFPSPHPHALG